MTTTFKEEVLNLEGYSFHVQYKDVKRLSLRLKPDLSLYVSVPRRTSKAQLKEFLSNNLAWVAEKTAVMQKKQQDGKIAYNMELPFNGKEIYLWGRRLQAEFYPKAASYGVRIEVGRAIFASPRQLSVEQRQAFVEEFYKMQVEEQGLRLLQVWQQQLGVKFTQLRLRLMKTRWGTCNVRTGVITLNKLLACYPPECLEYICVHELAHLLEANHSPRFHAIVERHLPDWRARKQLLRDFKPIFSN